LASAKIYLNNSSLIRKTLINLKSPENYSSISRISIEHNELINLRPLPNKLFKESKNDADLMTKWRKKHVNSFVTIFKPTVIGTKKWLQDCYFNNSEDIIFFVETVEKVPFGHLSLYNFDFSKNECEYGRVIKGANLGPKDSMKFASLELINWGFNILKLNKIYLEVFEDNFRAVKLYKKIGFSIVQKIPCILIKTGNLKMWKNTDTNLDMSFKNIRNKYRMEIVKNV
jgi:RimJ/RimL family protein N-acetyltransferase